MSSGVAARALTSACSGRHLALLGAAAEAGVGQTRPTDGDGNDTDRTRGGTMKRRAVAALAGAVLFVWPLVASAQQPAKIARLGYLDAGDPTAAASVVRAEALRAGLRDLGHVEGKNLVIDFRWASTVGQLR